MGRNVVLLWPRQRPVCPDLEPACFELVFCEAWRCAVDLRRGLTGELSHCPMSGIRAVTTNRLPPSVKRSRAAWPGHFRPQPDSFTPCQL